MWAIGQGFRWGHKRFVVIASTYSDENDIKYGNKTPYFLFWVVTGLVLWDNGLFRELV